MQTMHLAHCSHPLLKNKFKFYRTKLIFLHLPVGQMNRMDNFFASFHGVGGEGRMKVEEIGKVLSPGKEKKKPTIDFSVECFLSS